MRTNLVATDKSKNTITNGFFALRCDPSKKLKTCHTDKTTMTKNIRNILIALLFAVVGALHLDSYSYDYNVDDGASAELNNFAPQPGDGDFIQADDGEFDAAVTQRYFTQSYSYDTDNEKSEGDIEKSDNGGGDDGDNHSCSDVVDMLDEIAEALKPVGEIAQALKSCGETFMKLLHVLDTPMWFSAP